MVIISKYNISTKRKDFSILKKDFIPITIELKKKINYEDLKKQFTINQTPIKKRASIVAKITRRL